METFPAPAPFELLAFYVDSGVDEAIGPQAVNRFQTPAPPTPKPVPATPLVVPQPPQPATSAVSTGARLAASCSNLDELKAAMESLEGLAIKSTALNTVFADGAPTGSVMLIGEAPGHEEDVQGRPFVGKSGKLLDKMLASIGLGRADTAYITNVVPWRPMENRTPSAEEVAICRPFLMRHVELVAPKVLILLGGVPASTVLETTTGITRLRGAWHQLTLPGLAAPLAVMPTFHPSYLLRTPAGKRLAWRDFLEVAKRLNAQK